MNNSKESDPTVQTENNTSDISRRSFFKRAAIVRAIGVVAAGGLATLASAVTKPEITAGAPNDHDPDGLERLDRDVLVAADAEALALATYSTVTQLADDQCYLMAAQQQEMSHYLLEQSLTDQFTPFTSFFYPFNMFADTQTLLNTLVTLEDAFIAAYLAGLRNLSTPQLRVTAALIRGTENDHSALAGVAGPGVAAQDGEPIETTTVLFISPGRA